MIDINKNADLTLQFFCKSLAKEFYHKNGIMAWYSGIDNKSLNSVISSKLDDFEINESIERIIIWFNEKKISWNWIVNSFSQPNDLEHILRKYEFNYIDEYETLKFDLNYLDINIDKDIYIKEVKDTLGITQWAHILNEAFKAEDNDLSYLKLNLKISDNSFSHYVLYTKGEPVTAASVSYSQYGARIDNVATKNNYLRQGYASKITLYILKQAKKLGFRYCYLDASDLGLQLYKKLGFTVCYSNKIYSLN